MIAQLTFTVHTNTVLDWRAYIAQPDTIALLVSGLLFFAYYGYNVSRTYIPYGSEYEELAGGVIIFAVYGMNGYLVVREQRMRDLEVVHRASLLINKLKSSPLCYASEASARSSPLV